MESTEGRTPEKCHAAVPPGVCAGPGAARPHIQKRRMDRAHNAPVPAVHVDVRPPPAVSIDTPPYLYGSGGWGRKITQGISADRPTATLRQRPDAARAEIFPEQVCFPD